MMRRKLFLAATVVAASLGFTVGPASAGGANDASKPYYNDCQMPNCQASANGKGNGNANGRPAAGSVGNADGKNPPGQVKKLPPALSYPADDGDSGYECDSNFGVGLGNPAHSPCTEVVPE